MSYIKYPRQNQKNSANSLRCKSDFFAVCHFRNIVIERYNNKRIIKKTWYGAWKDDPQYINTCVDHVYEKTGGKTIFTSLEEIKAKLNIK